MKLLNVTRRVADLLLLTHLLMAFECFDRESDALASFDRLATGPSLQSVTAGAGHSCEDPRSRLSAPRGHTSPGLINRS